MTPFLVALAAAAFLFWFRESSDSPWALLGAAALVVMAGIGADTLTDRATKLICEVPIVSMRCERPAYLFPQ